MHGTPTRRQFMRMLGWAAAALLPAFSKADNVRYPPAPEDPTMPPSSPEPLAVDGWMLRASDL